MGDGCQPASGHAHYAAVLLRVNLPSLSPLPQLDCRASVQVQCLASHEPDFRLPATTPLEGEFLLEILFLTKRDGHGEVC